jgi:NitT/TauT family transport system substrate-binding protein
MGLGLFGCGNAGEPSASASAASSSAASPAAADPLSVRVASLKGPTSIGLVQFIDKARESGGELVNAYDFTIAGTADEILPGLINGEMDIALLPANVASVLYNRT